MGLCRGGGRLDYARLDEKTRPLWVVQFPVFQSWTVYKAKQ